MDKVKGRAVAFLCAGVILFVIAGCKATVGDIQEDLSSGEDLNKTTNQEASVSSSCFMDIPELCQYGVDDVKCDSPAPQLNCTLQYSESLYAAKQKMTEKCEAFISLAEKSSCYIEEQKKIEEAGLVKQTCTEEYVSGLCYAISNAGCKNVTKEENVCVFIDEANCLEVKASFKQKRDDCRDLSDAESALACVSALKANSWTEVDNACKQDCQVKVSVVEQCEAMEVPLVINQEVCGEGPHQVCGAIDKTACDGAYAILFDHIEEVCGPRPVDYYKQGVYNDPVFEDCYAKTKFDLIVPLCQYTCWIEEGYHCTIEAIPVRALSPEEAVSIYISAIN